MGKTFLVTGAAGFIGSAIARKLISQGHEIWSIDNLSTGFRSNIPSAVHCIEGDCQEARSIAQLGNTRFDAIVHIAGQSSGEISFDDPSYDLRTNTESTLRLIKFGLEHGCTRFIYASSMSVYGNVSDQPIAGTVEPKPLSFYGVGKLASEHYLRIYESKGLKPTALRYFNVYGPGQNMGNVRQGMVSIFLAQLIKNDQVIVKGTLDRFRDMIYIDDVVNQTIAVINDARTHGKNINIATGIQTSVGELLQALMDISGIHKKITIAAGTPGDQKGIYADISVARSFGLRCEWSLKQGLTEMVEWAKTSKW